MMMNIFCDLVAMLQLMKKMCRLRARQNRINDDQRQDAGIVRQSDNAVCLVLFPALFLCDEMLRNLLLESI